ncbi:serine hydrolase domain-containing protein [Sphingopyxis sp.]|uniref:serine hydrolase domain-containing protein n=1 Tax=Sphingopyxis sp. TaxID=1908224 RepID=UPI003D812392
MRDLLDYVRSQNTTGFVVMHSGKTLVEENWPAPEDLMFAIFRYGQTDSGALFEDVASQQKSFIAILMAVAADKSLIDVDRPVSDYIGVGWSLATAEQERRIKVIHILQMNSGLDEKFAYVAPAGTQFLYNTPVYAVSKQILTKASKLSLEQLTRDWLTAPAAMTETDWRQRPAAFAGVGNNTALVTSPRDTALFGQMILNGGVASNGKRIVSAASLQALFDPSPTNAAYGRLWWLNGGGAYVRVDGRRDSGPLIPEAPADLVAAFGFLDRRLYVVPSLNLVVVRTGADAADADFDQQLWQRLAGVLGSQSIAGHRTR